MPLTLDRSHVLPFLDDRPALDDRVAQAHRRVLDGETEMPEMLGWRRMLLDPDDALLESVAETAAEIRDRADVLLCIGIGGSYLGAEAVMQALDTPFSDDGPEILFAGHHLGPEYHERLFQYLDGKSVYVNVISKSGTTLEPALAFRFARRFVERHFDDADRRIIATTDADRGALHDLAVDKGYRRYVVPNGVGGRFSVLTPVGLLPIAASGVDTRSLFYGAVAGAREVTDADAGHPALQYAGDRYALGEQGYKTEVMAVMDPALRGIGAWWQQLFGESEGKDGKGLFPVVLQYTTDLHSVGQYVQQGQRTLVESFLRIDDAGEGLEVAEQDDNGDGLNYLAGKTYGEINEKAYAATAEAHAEGGVPNWTVTLPRLDAENVGRLIHFYEHAVSVSGTLLGVNPFNQPGVENYKQKMFSLLGKPS
ncbi:glucose-6-phosphate isomerase [Rubrivirga sp. S365]|uniref:glucose-6-phosphate isomerase n=1 Tax=Rubrivirga sp. S365 TaxID=3076080 RepID=UPI0028C839C3|nr:glucose-6-phosphate isomerase [Rubrivirga sp. S365]MDT7855670.1 glucose-6-phosphate isomerase [Rubrivirga sp. S365]